MKFSAPWSTEIVDTITKDPIEAGLLRLWIWCDRVMWIAATVLLACALALAFK